MDICSLKVDLPPISLNYVLSSVLALIPNVMDQGYWLQLNELCCSLAVISELFWVDIQGNAKTVFLSEDFSSVCPNAPCPKEEKNVFSIAQAWVVSGMRGCRCSYDILSTARQVIHLQNLWRKNPIHFFSIPWAVWAFQTLLEHMREAGLLKKPCVCGEVTKVGKLIPYSNVNWWNIFHSKRYHILYISGS